MSKEKACVAIINTHVEAENAVKELQRAGFDMKKLSVVGRDYDTGEHVIGYYNTGERVSFWGELGAFWGGLFGLLFGSAFLLVPGIGPLIAAGPIVAALVGCLGGAGIVGGLSALGAALYSIGIPKDSIIEYETAIKSENFILVVHGSANEVAKAGDILENMNHKIQIFCMKEQINETIQ